MYKVYYAMVLGKFGKTLIMCFNIVTLVNTHWHRLLWLNSMFRPESSNLCRNVESNQIKTASVTEYLLNFFPPGTVTIHINVSFLLDCLFNFSFSCPLQGTLPKCKSPWKSNEWNTGKTFYWKCESVEATPRLGRLSFLPWLGNRQLRRGKSLWREWTTKRWRRKQFRVREWWWLPSVGGIWTTSLHQNELKPDFLGFLISQLSKYMVLPIYKSEWL